VKKKLDLLFCHLGADPALIARNTENHNQDPAYANK
jgi:hypothetical protein